MPVTYYKTSANFLLCIIGKYFTCFLYSHIGTIDEKHGDPCSIYWQCTGVCAYPGMNVHFRLQLTFSVGQSSAVLPCNLCPDVEGDAYPREKQEGRTELCCTVKEWGYPIENLGSGKGEKESGMRRWREGW